jgi:hypothetical protein
MRPTGLEQHEASVRSRHSGRRGEGCTWPSNGVHRRLRSSPSRPLPGFQAYPGNKEQAGEGRALPGFGASSYRDFRHTVFGGRCLRATGISGMRLPGIEPHGYREVGHTGAGTWGTNEPASTGNSGMNRPANLLLSLAIAAGNLVSRKPYSNSPTRGDAFSYGGRGPCPRKA